MGKATAQTVHQDLKIHEKMCDERWKTCFNQLSGLDEEMKRLRLWLITGLGSVALSLFLFVVTNV